MTTDFLSDNAFVREVWNGAWFVLGAYLVLALTAVAAHRAIVLRHTFAEFYRDQAMQVAVSMVAFAFGSCIRAGYIWLLLHCRTFSATNCTWIEAQSWAMPLGGLIAIVGGLCLIRIISPPSWRPWSWLACGVLSLSVPVAYYFLE